MIGKVVKKVLLVLSIGTLHCTVLGCTRNSDCVVQTTSGTRKHCCSFVTPPRCMNLVACLTNAKFQYFKTTPPIPTNYPTYYPDYDKFTVPKWPKNTVPDFNEFTLPDYNIPHHIDNPTYHFNDNDDYDPHDSSDGSDGSEASSFSPGALFGTVVATIIISVLIFCFRYLRYRQRLSDFRGNCVVRPRPLADHTSRTNLVSQGSEQPRRIVVIAITRSEGESRDHNRPPDGEPPFLSEEDILNGLHNVSAQEPPPYDEAALPAGPHLPKYEDVITDDLPPPPAYDAACTNLATASSVVFIDPPEITPTVQEHLHVPDVNPPQYEEPQAVSNYASG